MSASGLDGSSIRQKVEIRFAKRPEIRFLSHLDLVRAFHRALRRARIPVRLTQGFNPRPRIVFPVPIEVGTASEDDVAELELAREMSLEEIASRLAPVLPCGLVLRGVRILPCRRRPGKVREIACALDLAGLPWKVSQADVAGQIID
jgi:radical SAM-linked protein